MVKKIQKNYLNSGDVFTIRLTDGSILLGQVLDFQLKHIIRCAFFNERFQEIEQIGEYICKENNVIALLSVTKEYFISRKWKIIGNKPIDIFVENYSNERFRNSGWVGAKIYNASIIEDFLNAFYTLSPWDIYYNTEYFDDLLYDKKLKPMNLIFCKKKT